LMSFRSRTRTLLTILPLCAASVVGAQPQEEVVFFDEAVPAGAEYYAPSEGIAIGGDYLLRHANGALPLTTEGAFSGASAAVVSYQHVEGGTWEWRIAPPGGSSVDLTGFDSLIVYVNGPDALSG